ncbi:MAG: flagellar hook protein FliD [Sulfobacillus acidophilus]|uniref:Flagellar hook-associated protein 2 n=1 Tax=Sulfobacillus acidophilus TaxID=53633 RepID=A0A2T2WLB0_9FIRM|nr:MAG: flagellar hook protein FliD [Sulfobacillus acidophilus]
MSINWSQVYSGPIGQILSDLSPTVFTDLATQESQSQLTTLQDELSSNKSEISAWTTLQSDAQSFNSALHTLTEASTYNQLQTSSSNNVVTAVDSSALAGQYTLTVQSVAQAEIDSGTAANMTVTDPNSTLSVNGTTMTGAFSLSVGGTTINVTIPTGGTSLNGLASSINSAASAANAGLTASVVQNGQGDYVLELQATQTDQPITYADTSGSPLYDLGLVSSTGTGTQSAANVLQAPSAAEVSFGSTFNSADAVTSSNNTFSNLIPGLTVTVNSPGTTTISVTPNVSAMEQSVQTFASAWNQWVSDTQSLAQAGQVVASGSGASESFSYQANSSQVLTSAIPTAVLNQVQQLLGSYSTNSGSLYQSLANLGLTFSVSGQLSVNSTTLNNAITTDPSAVQAIFQGLQSSLQSGGALGIVSGFSLGPTSTTGEAIDTLTQQDTNIQNQETLLNQKTTAEEQQAIVHYGQWVNQVAQYSQQYDLLNAIFTSETSSSNTSGVL